MMNKRGLEPITIIIIVIAAVVIGGVVIKEDILFSPDFLGGRDRSTQEAQTQRSSCTDSDGGINYDEKGTACVRGVTTEAVECLTDFCIDSSTLKEYYCDGIIRRSIIEECDFGCINGRCLAEGASYPLFTSANKIYLNDSINKIRSIVTDSNLPIILADGEFIGDIGYFYTQVLHISSTSGVNNRFVYGKHPTSDDDPVMAIDLGTTSGHHIYNSTVTFNQAVDFTHPNSIGQEIILFGKDLIVGPSNDTNSLVLHEEGQVIFLSSNSTYSEVVVINGEAYIVELVSASDTAATIRVIDSEGNSDTETITEGETKELVGILITVLNADETDFVLSAELIVSGDKLKFSSGSPVRKGIFEETIDGTKVVMINNVTNLYKLIIQTAAEDTDVDAIREGEIFRDPVFQTFGLDFKNVSFPENSPDRENIDIENSGNNKMVLTMKDHQGFEKTINWLFSDGSGNSVLADSTGDRIRILEMTAVNKSEYVIIGNENDGHLLEVITITNSSSGFENDEVSLKDVFSDEIYEVSITSEGQGIVTISGDTYTINYFGDSNADPNSRYIKINYPDSSGNNLVIYPTIESSKGAKVAFYEPLIIGELEIGFVFKIPNGNGYTDIVVVDIDPDGTFTINDQTVSNSSSAIINVGQISYEFTWEAPYTTKIFLLAVSGEGIVSPGLVIFEEQDADSSNYDALIVKTEGQGTSANGVGILDVETTWGNDGQFDEIQLESDTDIYKSMDRWGVIITTDQSDTDQNIANIKYNDGQVWAGLYAVEIL